MSSQADFANYCAELLSGVGAVRSKRMCGGAGLYIDDLFMAIGVGETLFLKADDQTQARFAAEGCRRFEYTARGETHSTNYWSVPAEAMDSPHLMAPWARLAVEAAVRAGTRKGKSKSEPKAKRKG